MNSSHVGDPYFHTDPTCDNAPKAISDVETVEEERLFSLSNMLGKRFKGDLQFRLVTLCDALPIPSRMLALVLSNSTVYAPSHLVVARDMPSSKAPSSVPAVEPPTSHNRGGLEHVEDSKDGIFTGVVSRRLRKRGLLSIECPSGVTKGKSIMDHSHGGNLQLILLLH